MVQACLIYAACGSSNLPSAFAKKIMFQRTCWSERQTSWEKTCAHNHSIFNFDAEETLAFCFALGTRGPRVWFSTQKPSCIDLIGIVFFSAELANRTSLSIFQSEKLFSFCFLYFISPFTKTNGDQMFIKNIRTETLFCLWVERYCMHHHASFAQEWSCKVLLWTLLIWCNVVYLHIY